MDKSKMTFKELLISHLGEEAYENINSEIEKGYKDSMSVHEFKELFEKVMKKYENHTNIVDSILPFIPCSIHQESKK